MRGHASFGRDAITVAVAAAVGVLALSFLAHIIDLDLRTQVAPVITAGGVIAAVGLFYVKEASDRRRRTLEAFERQLYDSDLRGAVSTVVTALRQRTYESDLEPDRPGSHRDLTSFIINYVEACCEGARRGMYDREMMQELPAPIVKLLIDNFLVERDGMPTRRFLDVVRNLEHTRDVFAPEFELAWSGSAWRSLRR